MQRFQDLSFTEFYCALIDLEISHIEYKNGPNSKILSLYLIVIFWWPLFIYQIC